jgi:hypothetical protein
MSTPVELPSSNSATLSLTGVTITSTLPAATTKTIFKMLTEVQDVVQEGEAFKRMVVEVDGGVYVCTIAEETIYILLTVR